MRAIRTSARVERRFGRDWSKRSATRVGPPKRCWLSCGPNMAYRGKLTARAEQDLDKIYKQSFVRRHIAIGNGLIASSNHSLPFELAGALYRSPEAVHR